MARTAGVKPARSSRFKGLLVDKRPTGLNPADGGESRDVRAGGEPVRRSTAPAAKTFSNIQDHHSDRAACVTAASSCALRVSVPRHALGNPPWPWQLVEEPDGGVVDPRSWAFVGRHGWQRLLLQQAAMCEQSRTTHGDTGPSQRPRSATRRACGWRPPSSRNRATIARRNEVQPRAAKEQFAAYFRS